MKKLSTFFTNPFLSPVVLLASRENKEQHCTQALGALTQNPPSGAAFPPLIEAYRLAVENYRQQKQASSNGLQLAASERVKMVRKSFVATARYLSSKLRSDYEGEPGEYTTFFPQGLYKATRTKRGDMDDLLIRWHRLAQDREAVMGSALVARLADLLAAWKARTSEQAGMMSRVQMARSSVSGAWEEVAWAAYALARAMVDANPRQPKQVDVYFDFRMFTRAQNRDTDGKADIRGMVKSPAGFPVFRALVTFTQVGGGKVYQMRSNTRGVFRKKRMLPSVYDFTVKAAGFSPFQSRVQLLDRANPDLEVVLQAV